MAVEDRGRRAGFTSYLLSHLDIQRVMDAPGCRLSPTEKYSQTVLCGEFRTLLKRPSPSRSGGQCPFPPARITSS